MRRLRRTLEQSCLPIALAITSCTPNRAEKEKVTIDNTGIWVEPLRGGVTEENRSYFMDNKVIVKFDEEKDTNYVESLSGGKVTGYIPQLQAYEIEVDDVDGTIRSIDKSDIIFVSRNYLFEGNFDNEDYSGVPENLPENADYLERGLWWSSKIKVSEGLQLIENYPIDKTTIAVIDLGFNYYFGEIPYYYTDEGFDIAYDFGDNDKHVHMPNSPHGSIVSSLIAGKNNGALTNGVAAIDNIYILPLKTQPTRDWVQNAAQDWGTQIFGDDFRFAAALEYTLEKSEEANVKVVNISQGANIIIPEWLLSIFGANNNIVITQDAINDLTGKDIIVVASAGNRNQDSCTSFPSAHKGVISVVGTKKNPDSSEDRADFSNHSVQIDCNEIAAPAADILVFDTEEGSYDELNPQNAIPVPILENGTSASAPMVSGLVALMKSIEPELSFEDVVRILRDNADDVSLADDPDPMLRDQVWKRINVRKTLASFDFDVCGLPGSYSDYVQTVSTEFFLQSTVNDSILYLNEVRADSVNVTVQENIDSAGVNFDIQIGRSFRLDVFPGVNLEVCETSEPCTEASADCFAVIAGDGPHFSG